jgi:hypothetical protein
MNEPTTNLADDAVIQEGRLNRQVLLGWLVQLSDDLRGGACLLLSRTNQDHPWQQTGLFVDQGQKRIYAKVGNAPYQPLGMLDDDVFVPNEEPSKLFWSREFSLVEIKQASYPGAFTIQKKAVMQDESTELAMSDQERAQAEEVLGEIKQDLDRYKALPQEEHEKAAKELFEAIKFYSIKLPRVDRILAKFAQDHPEMGPNLENAHPVSILMAVADLLQKKLTDDQLRRQIAGVTMVRTDLDIARQLIARLTEALPQGNEPPDGERLTKLIHAAYLTDPVLRPEIDRHIAKEATPLETAQAVLAELERRVKNG